ncbi:MAG: zf-HC2 domain-containing protein [Pseudomonadota bacterium]|nr:zf-HC2 domain-containing protein [Pseudomonadota bacterium]
MLNCRDVAHEASDYIDQNLSWWRRLMFRLHLFVCAKCRRFVAHVHLTRDFLRRRGPLRASDQDIEQVMQRVKTSAPDQS